MLLDFSYLCFRGLNFSWEMLEGLVKYNGFVIKFGWVMCELDVMFLLDFIS